MYRGGVAGAWKEVGKKKKLCFVLEVFFVVYDRRGEAIVLEFI